MDAEKKGTKDGGRDWARRESAAQQISLIKIRLISGTISGTGSCIRQIALSGYLLPRGAGAHYKAERGADPSE